MGTKCRDYWLGAELSARGLDYLLAYPDLVAAVTRKDLQRVAQTWLDADNFVCTSAG